MTGSGTDPATMLLSDLGECPATVRLLNGKGITTIAQYLALDRGQITGIKGIGPHYMQKLNTHLYLRGHYPASGKVRSPKTTA